MQGIQKGLDEGALILGITGSYGAAMAKAMLAAGWRVRALVRSKARAEAMLDEDVLASVTLVEGDVLDATALRQAACGVDVIVHGINVPYRHWASLMLPMTDAVIDAAAEAKATIAFPGNIYAFSPDEAIAPDTPPRPPTQKGELRLRMERMLAGSAERGVRVITLRGGDFFGTNASNTWMHQILKKARRGGAFQMPKHRGVRHAWAYLPDFARTHVMLLGMRQTLPNVATFHFRGHVLTEEQLIKALREAMDAPTRRVSYMPWWIIRLGGIVMPDWRGLAEMNYLWTSEVLMTQRGLEETLPHVPHTPLRDALHSELASERGWSVQV